MAVREFDGVDDKILCALGNVDGNLGGGPFTLLVVAKPTTKNAGEAYLSVEQNGSSSAVTFFDNGGNQLAVGDDSYYDGTGVGATASAWQILAVTCGGPSNQPRYHRKVLGSGTWTHQSGGANWSGNFTVADQLSYGALLNGAFSSFRDFRLAVGAVFNTVLSDADIESIQTTPATQTIYDLLPQALHDFNQASVSTAVVDLTGGTADETGRTGTTVVTTDDPTGWTFGVGGGGGTSQLLAATIASVSTAAGALKVEKPLGATIASTSSVAGALQAQKKLAATIASTSGVAGALQAQKKLAASIASTSTVAASIQAQKALAATIAGVSSVASALHVQKPLAAAIQGVSGVAADLQIAGEKLIAATIDATSGVAATLATTKNLGATVASTSTVTAAIGATKNLGATVASTSTVTAAIGATKNLAATVAGSSGASAVLNAGKPLAAAIASTSSFIGRLFVDTGVEVTGRVYQSLQMIRTRIGW